MGQRASGEKPPLPDDDTYYEKQIRRTRARRELEEEDKKLKELDNPPQEPAFQVHGGINLGEIDIQEMQRKQEEKAEKERQDAAQRAEKLSEDKDKLQEDLYKEKMDNLRNEFSAKMDLLQKTIEGGGSKKSFTEQFAETQEIAKQLGFEKTSVGTDPKMELEIKKLEWQMKKEDREFQRQMKKDEREWQLRMEELKDQRYHKDQELNLQAKRDDMFAKAPAAIGGAIAKGMMESGGESTDGHISGKSKKYHIEAEDGIPGEVECPDCHTMVGIGPTSTGAVCVGCNSRFAIKRTPGAKAPETVSNEEEE